MVIAGYLGVMSAGVAAHALGFGLGSHPLMYYIVWDMFCGWSAQSYRTHVIAEGESGTWYDAGVGPWDARRPFRPYGDLKRIHYDVEATHAARLGLNVLRHTAHEPIVRIAVVEECWAKKFNMPEPYWSARWNVPKDPASYYAVRHTLTADGQLIATKPSWAAEVARQGLQRNERIRRLASRPGVVPANPLRPAGYERVQTAAADLNRRAAAARDAGADAAEAAPADAAEVQALFETPLFADVVD